MDYRQRHPCTAKLLTAREIIFSTLGLGVSTDTMALIIYTFQKYVKCLVGFYKDEGKDPT